MDAKDFSDRRAALSERRLTARFVGGPLHNRHLTVRPRPWVAARLLVDRSELHGGRRVGMVEEFRYRRRRRVSARGAKFIEYVLEDSDAE